MEIKEFSEIFDSYLKDLNINYLITFLIIVLFNLLGPYNLLGD